MNVATIGTGMIVDKFLEAVEKIKHTTCVALYSRKAETALTLAKKYNIATIYTDLDKMLNDPTIDIVYIASPNSLHFEHTYKALQLRKHVICEKPFTSTVQELEILSKLAKQNNLMLFEAITTIYLPNYQLIKENVAKLGQIRFIQANYSQYSSKYNALLNGETPNVFNPKFSGGALTDINIYNIHFVMNMFGSPKRVHYVANKHENGIDTSGVIVFKYPNFICELVGCKDTNSMNFVLIQGEKGYIHVVNGANGCSNVVLHIDGKEIELNIQTETNLLYYEIHTFADMFKLKKFQECYTLLDYSHSVLQILETARHDADIVFEADNKANLKIN